MFGTILLPEGIITIMLAMYDAEAAANSGLTHVEAESSHVALTVACM